MGAQRNAGRSGKLSVRHLVAATYFMVSGGPYGLEELMHDAGYLGAVIALLVTPFLWSLPTALMVSELSSAVPEEGGYYAWVKRALGPFWGFQEAWLSLAASVFDMAIYPTLFTLYLGRLWPVFGSGIGAFAAGIAMIAACAAWNVRGARSVGGSAVVMTVLLLAPFAVLAAIGFAHPAPSQAAAAHHAPDMLGALMIAMWNYMGWDNASTIAGEVERPQRTYPVAMLVAVALVAITYVIPVAAMARSGIDPASWTTGSWADAGGTLAGRWLAVAIVAGGVVCAFGMFNALVLSYTRLPPALAEDGYLPKVLAKRHPRSGAPWVSIVVCAALWACCLGIGFSRLVAIDLMLYGLSLLLEFAALVALRVREPSLPRPFRVWGGLAGAALVGVAPAALIAIALLRSADESIAGMNAIAFSALVIAAGPAIYALGKLFRRKAA
ncbi:MAG TPA: APC family permease [Candidatus Binatia bacterium]|nr:APC family permease [Candidatus Binatia bacterium]